MSNNGSPRFTDFPSLCACSESSLTNLIGSGLNLLCLQIHSKPECRWTWPEVSILGADQKERGLWGRECSPRAIESKQGIEALWPYVIPMEKSGIAEWTRYNCLLRNSLNIPGGRAERTRQLTNLKLSLSVQCSGMSIFTAFISSLCCFLEKAQLCHRPNKSPVLRLHLCCTHTQVFTRKHPCHTP